MRLNLRNLVNSKNLREAITRKLADMLKNIDVVKDNEFKSSIGVLNGMLKNVSWKAHQYQLNTNIWLKKWPRNIINFEDALNNPIKLRLSVYFNLAIHFLSRNQEFNHQLKLNSFTFRTVEKGEYAMISYEIHTKNNQGGLKNVEMIVVKRMYSTGTIHSQEIG